MSGDQPEWPSLNSSLDGLDSLSWNSNALDAFLSTPSESIELTPPPTREIGTGVVRRARQYQESLLSSQPTSRKRSSPHSADQQPPTKRYRPTIQIPTLQHMCHTQIRLHSTEVVQRAMHQGLDAKLYGEGINTIFRLLPTHSLRYADLEWFARSPFWHDLHWKDMSHVPEGELASILRILITHRQAALETLPPLDLCLENCAHIQGRVLEEIIEANETQFARIDLTGCHQLRPELLRNFMSFVDRSVITSISLSGCSSLKEEDLLGVLNYPDLRALSHLDLSRCSSLQDNTLQSILQKLAVAGNTLTSLNINQCPKLTGKSLHSICSSCPSLSRIAFNDLRHVTESALLPLLRFCRGLELFRAKGTVQFSSRSLEMIVQNSKQMEDLDLSCCVLPSRALTLLQQAKAPLKRLSLMNMKSPADDINPLMQHCEQLQYLNLSGTDIDDRILRTISEHCTLLEELDVSFCPRISATGICDIVQRCEKLSAIHMYGLFIDLDMVKKVAWQRSQHSAILSINGQQCPSPEFE